MSRLAIVIPAYKKVYLDKTLLSIANQTCNDFTLYIGNDCSPYNLKATVDLYRDRINLHYHEFDENLGNRDLVAHWERCINMVRDEEWIWLFSDDDFMDTTCVENFYSVLDQHPYSDLFHYNVTQVDANDKNVKDLSSYPKVLTSEEYLKRRLNGDFYSFVVEYIFRKSHFLNMGRFENFDLAWSSDDATWIKLSNRNGIVNIDNSRVYWRESQFNISPNNWNADILKRKFNSQIKFAKWIYDYCCINRLQIDRAFLVYKLRFLFFKTIKDRIEFISFVMLRRILSEFYLELFKAGPPVKRIIFFYFYKIYMSIKKMMKKLLFWDFFKTKVNEVNKLSYSGNA
jgi:glycosyltransferase involved in cell wall biosynthesis